MASLRHSTGMARPGLAVPLISKIGGAVIAVGVVLDTIVHVFLVQSGQATIAGFSLPEHAAHLVVLVGMVLVLGGVMVQGARLSRDRREEIDARDQKEGEAHAIR